MTRDHTGISWADPGGPNRAINNIDCANDVHRLESDYGPITEISTVAL